MTLAVVVGSCTGSAPAAPFASSSFAPGSPVASPTMPVPGSPVASPTPAPTLEPTPGATPRPTARPRPTATPGHTTTPSACPTAPLVYHGSRSKAVIALTIDDGISASAVLADLAVLQDAQVNATWFPIGEVVADHPDVWRQVAAAGFPIANHTWDHRNLTKLDYKTAVADIRTDNTRVSAVIGEPVLPVVRPAGGNWNRNVLCEARTAGEKAVVLWDTTFGDTGSGDVAHLIANAEKGTNGSIILMHANRSLSQQALPVVIDFYRTRGFEFVTIGQLLGIGGAVPYP